MTQQPISDRAHDLLFGIRRSVRYHMKRVRFFSIVHRCIRVLLLAAGMSAFAAAIKSVGSFWQIAFSAGLALLSAIDLVVNTAEASRKHTELAIRFLDLEKRLVLAGASIDDKTLAEFEAERLQIESCEPPILRVLDTMCHNELLRAMGYPATEGHYVRIAWYQRVLAQFVDVSDHNLRAA